MPLSKIVPNLSWISVSVALAFLLLSTVTQAQTTNASCASGPESQSAWLMNEAGESPCLVWSRIQSLCLSHTSYINVPPLQDESYSYNAPTDKSSRCQCNSVSYSLMAACAYCQWPETSLPSEDNWSEDCEAYVNDGQDVQPLPAFAFHQWSGGTFDPDVAKTQSTSPSPASYTTTLSRSFPSSSSQTSASPSNADASNPASSSSSSSLSSSSSSSITGSGSGSSPGRSDSDSDNAETEAGTNSSSAVSKWAPIVGGVAGGLILLALLFVLWRWYFARKRSSFGAQSSNVNGKKGKKRIPYPYPALEGGLRRGSKSFLEMMGSNSSVNLTQAEKERDAELKRRTAELMSNPAAFNEPRTAPVPPQSAWGMGVAKGLPAQGGGKGKGSGNGKDGYKYTTTTQRLAERPVSLSASELGLAQGQSQDKMGKSGIMRTLLPPSKAHLRTSRASSTFDFSTPLSTSTPDGSMDSGNIHSPLDASQDENAARARIRVGDAAHNRDSGDASAGGGARTSVYGAQLHPFGNRISRGGTPSMDFTYAPETDLQSQRGKSKDRPTSENTLPSIYEPQTGAMTYRDSSSSSPFSASPFPTALMRSDTNKNSKTGAVTGGGKYPGTETLFERVKAGNKRDTFTRRDSEMDGSSIETIGAALGSGTKGRDSMWGKN